MTYGNLIILYKTAAQLLDDQIRFESDWIDDINTVKDKETPISFPYIHLTPPDWSDDPKQTFREYNIIYYVLGSKIDCNNKKVDLIDVIDDLQRIVLNYNEKLFNRSIQTARFGNPVFTLVGGSRITPNEGLTTNADYFLRVQQKVRAIVDWCE